MKTPIADFVKNYTESGNLRFHMPGHKGKKLLGLENLDITEIEGADVLYKAEGIIKESEENAAKLFGTAKTIYSAEGSSLAIRGMLYLLKLFSAEKRIKPLIFAGRNAHKTFITAVALLDFDVFWLIPKNQSSIVSCNITAEYVDECLSSAEEKPVAVYLTSPDYLGNILDIKAISKICKKHGVLLVVDNAHGAYLNFLEENLHPIHLGADICCDSAHKTLPVLTGGAYMHISKTAPQIFPRMAEIAMSIFASTSPSYLILQSLDLANKYLSENYRERLAQFINEARKIKTRLSDFGFTLYGNEPLKLTIAPKSFGYEGVELSQILYEKGIVCEFADPDFIVFMLTPETDICDLEKLASELLKIERKAAKTTVPPPLSQPIEKISIGKAVMSPSVIAPIEQNIGKISADLAVNCPPAIPIVICGEEITPEAVKCFEYYGIKTCAVVKTEED